MSRETTLHIFTLLVVTLYYRAHTHKTTRKKNKECEIKTNAIFTNIIYYYDNRVDVVERKHECTLLVVLV